MNEILIEESGNVLTNLTGSTTTVSPTLLPVLINGKSMLLLHNLTAEEYPFFSVNTLPPGKKKRRNFFFFEYRLFFNFI